MGQWAGWIHLVLLFLSLAFPRLFLPSNLPFPSFAHQREERTREKNISQVQRSLELGGSEDAKNPCTKLTLILKIRRYFLVLRSFTNRIALVRLREGRTFYADKPYVSATYVNVPPLDLLVTLLLHLSLTIARTCNSTRVEALEEPRSAHTRVVSYLVNQVSLTNGGKGVVPRGRHLAAEEKFVSSAPSLSAR